MGRNAERREDVLLEDVRLDTQGRQCLWRETGHEGTASGALYAVICLQTSGALSGYDDPNVVWQ